MIRLVILEISVVAVSALLGAGVYEQTVLDPAWPAKPSIVRPAEGGVSRKRFWVPGNITVVLALLASVWASWLDARSRLASIIALALFLVINAVTVLYFAPAVLSVERDGIEADALASRRWVALSRLRTPLALGVVVSLAVAVLLLANTMR